MIQLIIHNTKYTNQFIKLININGFETEKTTDNELFIYDASKEDMLNLEEQIKDIFNLNIKDDYDYSEINVPEENFYENKFYTTINEFKEYLNEEAFNRIGFEVPSEDEWIYDEIKNQYGIKYLDNTYWILEKDLDTVKKLIGKTMAFKYDKKYMNILMPYELIKYY